MLFVFLSLFLILAKGETTSGAWELMYPHGEDCLPKMLKSAILITDKCIDTQNGYSIHYDCNTINMNVTMEVYKGSNCYGGSVGIVHIGDVGKCFEEKERETFSKWACRDDFKVNFPYLQFEIPIYMNESDVGSPKNPIIGTLYSIIGKCLAGTEYKYHATSICDPKTQEGEIKLYVSGGCIIPVHTYKMKVGEVVDIGKFVKKSEQSMYVKYTGCKK